MPGRNESGKRLLEMCAEQELVVGNRWFKKKDVVQVNAGKSKVLRCSRCGNGVECM